MAPGAGRRFNAPAAAGLRLAVTEAGRLHLAGAPGGALGRAGGSRRCQRAATRVGAGHARLCGGQQLHPRAGRGGQAGPPACCPHLGLGRGRLDAGEAESILVGAPLAAQSWLVSCSLVRLGCLGIVGTGRGGRTGQGCLRRGGERIGGARGAAPRKSSACPVAPHPPCCFCIEYSASGSWPAPFSTA